MKYAKIILNSSTPTDVILSLIKAQSSDKRQNPGELSKMSYDQQCPQEARKWAKEQLENERSRPTDAAKMLLTTMDWCEIKDPMVLKCCPYKLIPEQIKWAMNLVMDQLSSLRGDTQSYQNFIKNSRAKSQDQILYTILRRKGLVDKKLQSLETDIITRKEVIAELQQELDRLNELAEETPEYAPTSSKKENRLARMAASSVFIRKRTLEEALKKAEIKLLKAQKACEAHKAKLDNKAK